MQMIQPIKNLGDSQTDHPEGLRYLRSVAKKNAKTLENQLDLLKSNQNIGICLGSKTDSKHVCLDDTSPTSSLRRNLLVRGSPFTQNDGNRENYEDNSDSYKQGVECWISGTHHEIDENHGNPGCKPRVPQITGLEIADLLSAN